MSELDEFFNTRYGYLTELIHRVDEIDNFYEEKFKNEKIKTDDDPIIQIQILLDENKIRTDSEYYDSTLRRLKSFFETEFCCAENKKLIIEFRRQLENGIKEVLEAIQNNTFSIPYVDELLNPRYRPQVNGWGYAFAKFFEKVFVGRSVGLYTVEEIIEPLKKYITFHYKSDVELYWLLIIALNLAQEELKETQMDITFDKNIREVILDKINEE